jgi:hypothetical protein
MSDSSCDLIGFVGLFGATGVLLMESSKLYSPAKSRVGSISGCLLDI